MAEEIFHKGRLRNQTLGWVQNFQGADFVGGGGGGGVKEGENLMGFVSSGYVFPDPLQVNINPSSVSDLWVSTASFGYHAPPCYRGAMGLDQPFWGTSGQSLSLSLSSHHHHHVELDLQRNEHPILNGGGYGNNSAAVQVSKSSVPLGPFTGYSSVLKGSRFLKPAQQLLVEICDVGRGILDEINATAESISLEIPSLFNNGINIDQLGSCSDGIVHKKRSKLLSMLDEVYRRYKQYYQQMQSALAAFESVAGLSGAAPFASLALRAMSKHFGLLLSQAQLNLSRVIDESGPRNEHRIPATSGFGADPPVWRPQRGLPERAVGVLRAWLFEHFLHPYPTDTDKIMLATKTGLTRNQVSNWFINARVRLWKPMVEEMHTLETRQNEEQRQKPQWQPTLTIDHRVSQPRCTVNRGTNAATSERTGESSLKRKSHVETIGVANTSGSGVGAVLVSNGGVSLTLGLHQNNAIGISDSYYPMNAARHHGLDLLEQNGRFGMRGGSGT